MSELTAHVGDAIHVTWQDSVSHGRTWKPASEYADTCAKTSLTVDTYGVVVYTDATSIGVAGSAGPYGVSDVKQILRATIIDVKVLEPNRPASNVIPFRPRTKEAAPEGAA